MPDTEEPRQKERAKGRKGKRVTGVLLRTVIPAIVTNSSKTVAALEVKNVHSFTIRTRHLAEPPEAHLTKGVKVRGHPDVAPHPPGKGTRSRVKTSKREHVIRVRIANIGILPNVFSFRKANAEPERNVYSYTTPRQRQQARRKRNQNPPRNLRSMLPSLACL